MGTTRAGRGNGRNRLGRVRAGAGRVPGEREGVAGSSRQAGKGGDGSASGLYKWGEMLRNPASPLLSLPIFSTSALQASLLASKALVLLLVST